MLMFGEGEALKMGNILVKVSCPHQNPTVNLFDSTRLFSEHFLFLNSCLVEI